MHFCVQPSPAEAASGHLSALHLSLNTPVIAIDELPVGPARAGISLRAGPAGECRLDVAVRALKTGQVVVYTPVSAVASEPELESGLEAALSFAEGMGFLFDEDEVAAGGQAGRASAEALWSELLEGRPGGGQADDAAVRRGGRKVEGAALLGGSNSPNPMHVLSKFRFRPGAIAAPPEAARTPTDSRIRPLSRF